jgi:hypothetical protein
MAMAMEMEKPSAGERGSSDDNHAGYQKQVVAIAIDNIHVGSRLRRLDPPRLEFMVDSIGGSGLLNTITMTWWPA